MGVILYVPAARPVRSTYTDTSLRWSSFIRLVRPVMFTSHSAAESSAVSFFARPLVSTGTPLNCTLSCFSLMPTYTVIFGSSNSVVPSGAVISMFCCTLELLPETSIFSICMPVRPDNALSEPTTLTVGGVATTSYTS